MRGRLVGLGVLAVGVPLAAMLAPVGPAGAVSAPQVSIVCDSRINWVHAGVSGGSGSFTPNLPVQVEFLVAAGSYVTASTQGTIPARGSTRTVEATTDATGGLTAAGYGRGWPLRSALFYSETVRVTVRNSAGGQLWQAEATCTRDLRTTVTLGCDRQAHTVTTRTAGVRYRTSTGSPLRIEYTLQTTRQQTAADPRFTGVTLGPGIIHQATPDSAGSFTDTGSVTPIADPEPYYYAERVWVTVWDFGLLVGRGEASCVYVDQGAG